MVWGAFFAVGIPEDSCKMQNESGSLDLRFLALCECSVHLVVVDPSIMHGEKISLVCTCKRSHCIPLALVFLFLEGASTVAVLVLPWARACIKIMTNAGICIIIQITIVLSTAGSRP